MLQMLIFNHKSFKNYLIIGRIIYSSLALRCLEKYDSSFSNPIVNFERPVNFVKSFRNWNQIFKEHGKEI